MQKLRFLSATALGLCLLCLSPSLCSAWHDETHVAIAKKAGYYKWFNACGADMAKLKAGQREAHNHYVNNPPDRVVTPEMIMAQVEKYNQVDPGGHLYGAIIASLRDYIAEKKRGKYGEYHLAFCAHYVADLSQPLHNTLYNSFNRKYHSRIDGIINDKVLDNLHRIKIYPIIIDSEKDLANEIARIANLAKELGYKIGGENRLLTREEAYTQISHSASLFKAILEYTEKVKSYTSKGRREPNFQRPIFAFAFPVQSKGK
ncbi:MAG: hypothetical protein JSW40_03860 [Candidatus Omnitrophota bacterium]|nr:MAG: hypothetical protein JSW40_03860 [Candidatus Omnitrophota bacterium]